MSAEYFELGYTSAAEFDLKQGKEYIVYGIILSNGVLSYLTVGEGSLPAWYPAPLFEQTRRDLPDDWFFAYLSKEEGYVINAIWGYEELVSRDDHFDGLGDLNKPDLEVFLQRKAQIDNVS